MINYSRRKYEKREIRYNFCYLIGAIAIASYATVNTGFAGEEKNSAEVAVKEFVTALNKGDAVTASKYVIDDRESERGLSTRQYEKIFKEYVEEQEKVNEVTELLDIDKENGKLVANLKIIRDDAEFEILVPLKKENKQWKLFVDGSIVTDISNSK
ncbi:DUF4878 domain-containing protein [Brevibacillus laterosporus]|nr:DUF4878 domain-containing protein [Brevibacillus laterosporus]